MYEIKKTFQIIYVLMFYVCDITFAFSTAFEKTSTIANYESKHFILRKQLVFFKHVID